ncbi:PAS domain-containing protein [Thioclava sp. JE_KL1]|uniref:PAS domain-containing protein n=1 Tax=Thioclava sp. JE_KL1 TaxID=2651187 RepID=UPI00128E0A3C|nr:PAS domain-containing protein [Thioclava sp. JE_KL1]MPQ95866.1 PAS domain-containing protein [Thioclava sp. JE_KL1]
MTDPTRPETEMIDILSRDGRIVSACAAQEAVLGLVPGAAAGEAWSAIYPLASRKRLEGVFTETTVGPHVVTLEMRASDGARIGVTAIVTRFTDPEQGLCLRTVKWPAGGALREVATLAEEKEILESILAASDDAGWCMEWDEPVDLSAPEQEIIRQVFENGPHWRFCNDAMARLYRTPEGKNFNALPVHETFPRSPENEDFVRRLIRASFDVNASPSRDLRYDGVFIEVENDVRGHIRGNFLYRMWGTVRDVSKHARRAAVLREEIDTLEAILDALPDSVLVVDRDARILRINTSAEELLDLNPDLLPARSIDDLIELPVPLTEIFAVAGDHLPGHPSGLYPVLLRNPDRPIRAELAARCVALRETECLVLSLRARLGPVSQGGDLASVTSLRARGQ